MDSLILFVTLSRMCCMKLYRNHFEDMNMVVLLQVSCSWDTRHSYLRSVSVFTPNDNKTVSSDVLKWLHLEISDSHFRCHGNCEIPQNPTILRVVNLDDHP